MPELLPPLPRDDMHHVVELLVAVADPLPPVDKVVKVLDEHPPHQLGVVDHQALNAAHVALESHHPLVSRPETVILLMYSKNHVIARGRILC